MNGDESRHSLRDFTAALSAATVLVAALALGAGILSFTSLLDARAITIDRIGPAAVTSHDLLAALVSQETGVRGFVLTSDEAFLEPFVQGQVDERKARARLGQALEDQPQLWEALANVDRRTAEWRTETADTMIADVRAGVMPDAVALENGRQRFDAVRSAIAALDAGLDDARVAARENLDRSTKRLVAVLLVALASLAAMGVAVRMAFTRGVLRPLLALGADARQVTAGELDHPIAVSGPSEIAQLATDVEAMRSGIVSALAKAEEARAIADERSRNLARSNAELEQFAYVASHDLQEPLRKVASFCQMLQQRYAGQLDERADQYIAFAVDGARRMQRLINDLLTFSRVGRTTDEFVSANCNLALEHALANLEPLIEETGGHVDAEPLPTVRGDLSLLTMLFQNVIGNSLKFRGEASPNIRVWARAADGDWLFSVADNGIGMDPQYAERVFVIFQRLHSKEEYPGTGIGLALCRKIVEYHEGRMWIDTEAHPGTTVRWTLPRTSADRREEAADDLAGN